MEGWQSPCLFRFGVSKDIDKQELRRNSKEVPRSEGRWDEHDHKQGDVKRVSILSWEWEQADENAPD